MQGAERERERQPNFNERIPPRKQPKQKRTKKLTSVGFSMMQNCVLLAFTSCFIFLSPLRSFSGFKQRRPLWMKAQQGLSHQHPRKETKYLPPRLLTVYHPYAICCTLETSSCVQIHMFRICPRSTFLPCHQIRFAK